MHLRCQPSQLCALLLLDVAFVLAEIAYFAVAFYSKFPYTASIAICALIHSFFAAANVIADVACVLIFPQAKDPEAKVGKSPFFLVARYPLSGALRVLCITIYALVIASGQWEDAPLVALGVAWALFCPVSLYTNFLFHMAVRKFHLLRSEHERQREGPSLATTNVAKPKWRTVPSSPETSLATTATAKKNKGEKVKRKKKVGERL